MKFIGSSHLLVSKKFKRSTLVLSLIKDPVDLRSLYGYALLREFCSSSSSSSSGGGRGKQRVLARTSSINSGIGKSSELGADALEEEDKKSRSQISKSLVGMNVHASYDSKAALAWRKRPLFNRQGVSVTFETGTDAAALLVNEARRRDPYQVDFLQSVEEAAYDVANAIEEQPKLAWVFKQLMEPERLVTFRVPWQDDNGNARLNRGYRIQYSSTLGPYRGGLRFHYHISHGSMRMLGWEQTLKNALVPHPFGGSKGGSDFDPSDKSDKEIQRFCASFIKAVTPFIISKVDAFETDLNVGEKEMQYLRESYLEEMIARGVEDPEKEVEYVFGSVNTFPEATGYGCAYFAERALAVHLAREIKGLRCLISGAGMLALSTASKLIDLGAVPITLSDTSGFIVANNGFTKSDLEMVAQMKQKHKKLSDFAIAHPSVRFFSISDSDSLWQLVEGDLAFPCITQGELNVDDAQALDNHGCLAVFEGADRACTVNARIILEDRNILYGSSKAANAGSIVCSGFSQELMDREYRYPTRQELEEHLKIGMCTIHDNVSEFAERYKMPSNLKAGANLASFLRIAEKELLH